MLTIEDVKKIGLLARIELSEDDLEKFQVGLSKVLEYVEDLKQVDVEGLEEVSQVTGLVNVQRADTPVVSEIHEAIFSEAPEMKDGYFKVKSIL